MFIKEELPVDSVNCGSCGQSNMTGRTTCYSCGKPIPFVVKKK